MNELDTESTAVEYSTDTGSQDTATAQSQDNLAAPDPTQDPAQTQAVGDGEKPVPFATGKEKFKVNGQEVEWDFDTVRRYAQMGFSSHQKWEQAAAIEKKAKETFSQLVSAAQSDPEGLIRMLNPSFQGFNSATQKVDAEEGQGQQSNEAMAYIKKLEARLSQFEDGFEKQAIAEERKAIESELEGAVKQYPALNNKIYKDYVKQQYAAALRKGLDVSLDDVAFHVSNEVQMQKAEQDKALKNRLEENRKKAPVTSVPGAAGSKPMSREEVMRLAGKTM